MVVSYCGNRWCHITIIAGSLSLPMLPMYLWSRRCSTEKSDVVLVWKLHVYLVIAELVGNAQLFLCLQVWMDAFFAQAGLKSAHNQVVLVAPPLFALFNRCNSTTIFTYTFDSDISFVAAPGTWIWLKLDWQLFIPTQLRIVRYTGGCVRYNLFTVWFLFLPDLSATFLFSRQQFGV